MQSRSRGFADCDEVTVRLLRHAGIDPLKPVEPSERVKALAQQPSQRIEAIKTYRQETGADLCTAKAMLDSLQNPAER